ncbi:hypothetical protein DFH07DRAFT_958329 [Mycena maculata]|uniref:Uncharacterized protein n=1 Tax=Mycena maculata TaxID=230809 RepID=A0AAD7NFE2_9AGAR|nr:hypothetical protein DFH07DRAFT_958329 [Mycena maculata]
MTASNRGAAPRPAPNAERVGSLQATDQRVASGSHSRKPPPAASSPLAATTTSKNRHIDAVRLPPVPFGSDTPCYPSTFPEKAPPAVPRARAEEVPDEGDSHQESTVYVLVNPLGRRGSPPQEPPQSAVFTTANVRGESREGTPLGSSKPTLSEESDLTPLTSEDRNGDSTPSPVGDAWRESPPHLTPGPKDNESVSTALNLRPLADAAGTGNPPPRFFSGFGCHIELYLEPLQMAVVRYHAEFDPDGLDVEDPLYSYGGIRGELPGCDPAASLALWDAITPTKIAQYDASAAKLIPIADPTSGERGYALNLKWLSKVAHAVVAAQQVLGALHSFLGRQRRTSFDIDPGFIFTYMLERCTSRTELLFALTSLQLRLVCADGHIRLRLCEIRQALTNEQFSDRLSSINSTISDVRAEFSMGHPQKELYCLLQRRDYGQRAALIDADAHRQMVGALKEEPRQEYYKQKRDMTVVPTIRESEEASAGPAPAAPTPLTAGVRFAPSIALSARRSIVSSLLGAGTLQDAWSLPPQSSAHGGPSMMRTPIDPRGSLPSMNPSALTYTTYTYRMNPGTSATRTIPAPTLSSTAAAPADCNFPNDPGSSAAMGDRRGRLGRLLPAGAWDEGEERVEAAAMATAFQQPQLNPKLNISVVPEWNSLGDAIIPYVVRMSYLALLSDRMSAGIAQMAPSKFTGWAMRWWNGLSIACRLQHSANWPALLEAIRRQFLTTEWLQERTQEFEEMRFRQKGHEHEDPFDFSSVG